MWGHMEQPYGGGAAGAMPPGTGGPIGRRRARSPRCAKGQRDPGAGEAGAREGGGEGVVQF
jgi:hypothetical protein